MTAPSEVVNASPPGPVNWHLRCVLRIGWLGFPRVGKLYTGTFRFQESNDQSCCKTEAFALTTGLVVLFPQARLSSITADRKSTRLNSSHSQISYAVFCLKKKKRLTDILTYLSQADISRP